MAPALEARNTGDMILFAQVVEAGTITGGSKRIGMERSTVSRRITSLEDRLGVSLLQRSTRKLRLTEIGRQYYQHCVRVVEAAEDAEAVAQRFRVMPSGVLRIGASICEADRFLAELIADFVDRYASVQVELDLDSDDNQRSLEKADVFLHMGRPSQMGATGIRLGAIDDQLWASPEYLQRVPVHSQFERLSEAAVIGLINGPDTVQWQLIGDQEQKKLSVVPRFRVSSPAASRDACISGLGVAKLPGYLCKEAERRGELQRIYQEWRLPGEPLYALHAENQYQTRKAKIFVEFLAEHCRDSLH